MTPEQVIKMNRSVSPSAMTVTFYNTMMQRYLDMVEYALDGGQRRAARGNFDVACAYARLSMQHHQAT